MEELVGPNVHVVLNVKEGKEFNQILNPTMIIATFNGHSLETEINQADSNPQYGTDLIWEVDKNILRKLRAGQAPLKVECYAIRDNGVKDKIGYLLLSLRSAQIKPRDKNVNVKNNWHRLLGLRNDLKLHKPELSIALTIEERPPVTNFSENRIDGYHEENIPSSILTPSLLHDERLIQLGPLSSCHDIFLLSIIAGRASNLESIIKNKTADDLHFCYRVLENDVRLKPFQRNTESSWSLSEKIVIRIRSSLSVLNNYLCERPFLYVTLRLKDDVLASSKIDLRPLVPTDDVYRFIQSAVDATTSLEQRCYLYNNANFNAIPEEDKPFLDLHLKLRYVGTNNTCTRQQNSKMTSRVPSGAQISDGQNFFKVSQEQENIYMFQKPSEIDSHRNPGGDFGQSMVGQEHCSINCENFNKHSSSCGAIKTHPNNILYSRSANAVLCSCNNEYSKSVEAYHCFCLAVSLNGIKLCSGTIIKNIEFRFHHPKAEIMSTLYPKIPILSGDKVKLQDIGCKLYFISSVDEIKHLLLSFPPKISICDVGSDPKMCLSQVTLDLNRLFQQNKTECQYEAVLKSDQNSFGVLDISIHLEDHGPYYKTKRKTTSESLGPPILDDTLAYKIVDELETWKERQKEIFRVELRRKEERHLSFLSEEWQRRRENLETKLACSVEQCKMLANSLNNATEDLRTRRLKSLETEARLIKTNEDMQWKYERKIQELKDAAREMQQDLMSKLSLLEQRKTTLEVEFEPTKLENERLRNIVTKQAAELEAYQKGSLTRDQTASLLQEIKALEEKLINAQKSKSFFKEEWAKAVREIHRMKMENHQAMEVQIKSSKEELRNLDLEELLCVDSTALTNDQLLLNQIQREIDVIKPKAAHSHQDIGKHVFPVTINAYPKTNRTGKSEENDEKLRTLIEQRDSLLKTGSYTIDDEVIVKINTEIRNVLITP